jgi:hypothetical protein
MASGTAAARSMSEPCRAAPMAMANFGCASTAVGRPVAALIISATSGMRDVPPTSRIRSIAAISSPVLRTARSSDATVSSMRGRTIASNSVRVSRTSV